MSQRIKTTKEDIAEYWNEVFPDKALQANVCWRCGIKKRLDRAHIQARSIEGLDQAHNFVLLCKHCHIDAPNVDDEGYMWEWLNYYRDRPVQDLWFFEGVLLFNQLYSQDLLKLIKGHEVMFYIAYQKAEVGATRHFGQPSLNASTVAAVIHASLLELHLIKA